MTSEFGLILTQYKITSVFILQLNVYSRASYGTEVLPIVGAL